jgi:hypothetical protein
MDKVFQPKSLCYGLSHRDVHSTRSKIAMTPAAARTPYVLSVPLRCCAPIG